MLLSADAPVSSVFVVARGAARVFGRLAGRHVTSALVPRGGCFGLAGLVPCTRSPPHTHTPTLPPLAPARRPPARARARAALPDRPARGLGRGAARGGWRRLRRTGAAP